MHLEDRSELYREENRRINPSSGARLPDISKMKLCYLDVEFITVLNNQNLDRVS